MHATYVSGDFVRSKSKKIFQDAITLVILIAIDLHLLKVALFFFGLKYYHRDVLIILYKE